MDYGPAYGLEPSAVRRNSFNVKTFEHL